MTRTRVNISVDTALLGKAKTKLHLFGGKLSTLFNAYLEEFVTSMDKKFSDDHLVLVERLDALETRMKKMEGKR